MIASSTTYSDAIQMRFWSMVVRLPVEAPKRTYVSNIYRLHPDSYN